MGIQLINRNPEPGETGVPGETDIFLEVISTVGTVVDANTSVFVNDVLAYSAGTFEPGFDGAASAASTPFAGTRRIRIDPTNDFDSEEEITVRVVSEDSSGALLDSSYSFTIEDLTTPTLNSAIALSPKTLRVTFSEPVQQAEATNASNYAISRLSLTKIDGTNYAAPQVSVSVVSVEKLTTSSYLLTTDIEMTFGTSYSVTATGIDDVSGNQIAPPLNSVTFVAFKPTPVAGRSFSLKRFLPKKNFREDKTGDLVKFVALLQESVDLWLYSIDKWTDILDPDIAPELFVDAMLIDLGNPFDFDLSLVDKRRLLRVLVRIYKSKGTLIGIERAVLFFLGLTIEAIPCNEDAWTLGIHELGDTTILGGGGPTIYSFEIVSPIELTEEQREQIRKIVDYMKVAHEHLKGFVEPTSAVIVDHWELGVSELGDTTSLH